MFDCRQDERTFWKTMNPARLHALFSAYFRKTGAAAQASKQEEPRSLLNYLMGGA